MEKPSNNSSLKGKVLNLQSLVRTLNESLTKHMNEVAQMQAEHNEGASFNVIDLKAKRIKMNMQLQLERLENQIKAHFSQQKTERVRLTEQITALKNEKGYLQKYLSALQKRINEVQLKLGVQDNPDA